MRAVVIAPFRDKNKPDTGYGVGDVLDVPRKRYDELVAAGVVRPGKKVAQNDDDNKNKTED